MLEFLLGFRKFTIIIITLVLCTSFLISGHIDGKTFGDVLKGSVVAYCTANVGEHLLNLGKEWIKNKIKKDK